MAMELSGCRDHQLSSDSPGGGDSDSLASQQAHLPVTPSPGATEKLASFANADIAAVRSDAVIDSEISQRRRDSRPDSDSQRPGWRATFGLRASPRD